MEFVYDGSLYEAAEHLMDEVCRGVNDLASTIAGLSKPEDLDVNLGEIAEELRSIRHVMAEGLKKVSSTGQDLMKLDEGFNAGYMASKYGRNTSLMENPQEGITYTESNFNNDNKYYFMYYEKAMEKMLESDKYTDEQKEKIREAKEKVHEYYEYYSNLIKLKEQENHLYMLENDKDYANKYIKENFGEEIAALKKSQGSQYMSPEAAIKTREINKIQEAINETKKECGIEIEKNWWEKFTSAVSNIKDSALKTGAAWGKAFNSGNLSDYGDALKQTGCTFVVTASSAASGAAKLGELVRDGLTFVGGSALSGVAWLFDHDTGKDLMDGTLDWIRKDLVGEANKYIYENTSIGKWINENSNLKYDSEGAQMIRKVTEFATKIGVATAATIATGGAAAPAAIGIGALYGTGNNVEKYAQSVDRENGESYDYKRAFLKAFAGAGTGAAEFYGYGQMGAGMLGVNISPKASTSFAKNFLTTGTLADTASVVIDHGVNVALGDENWQDALIYGGGELALALGMSAIGAKQATKSARAAEAAEDAAKAAKQLDKSIEALENIDGVHRIDFDNPIEYNKYLDSLTPEQRTKFMTEYYDNGSAFSIPDYDEYIHHNQRQTEYNDLFGGDEYVEYVKRNWKKKSGVTDNIADIAETNYNKYSYNFNSKEEYYEDLLYAESKNYWAENKSGDSVHYVIEDPNDLGINKSLTPKAQKEWSNAVDAATSSNGKTRLNIGYVDTEVFDRFILTNNESGYGNLGMPDNYNFARIGDAKASSFNSSSTDMITQYKADSGIPNKGQKHDRILFLSHDVPRENISMHSGKEMNSYSERLPGCRLPDGDYEVVYKTQSITNELAESSFVEIFDNKGNSIWNGSLKDLKSIKNNDSKRFNYIMYE